MDDASLWAVALFWVLIPVTIGVYLIVDARNFHRARQATWYDDLLNGWPRTSIAAVGIAFGVGLTVLVPASAVVRRPDAAPFLVLALLFVLAGRRRGWTRARWRKPPQDG